MDKGWMIEFDVSSCRHSVKIVTLIVQQVSCDFSRSALPAKNTLGYSIRSEFVRSTSGIVRSIDLFIERFKDT